jgi:hypothetical protein
MVDRSLYHLANIIVLAQMGDNHFRVLHCLFCFKVEDVHATKGAGPMSYCRGSGAVDAHP